MATEIRANIAELSSQNAEMAQRIKQLNQRLKELKGSQDAIVIELRNQLREMHEQMAAYQAQIDALKEQLADLSQSKDEDKDNIDDDAPVYPLARREVQVLQDEPLIDEEIDEIDHISGWKIDPRPTIHLKSGKTVNVWNRRAPFGSSVGNWQPTDPIAIGRKSGGNGIDPYIVRNQKIHETVDGNKNGNPFDRCEIL
jgi:chaperonin cofactor prefoldin